MEYYDERKEVAYFTRRLYRRRLTTTSGGNVSLRVSDDLMAITPAALDKARTRASQVALVGNAGHTLTPGLRPSSETPMHLRIYASCPGVRAVIHAHPTTACVFTCTDTPLNLDLLAEPYALVDPPVIAPFALSGSGELAGIVAECATRSSSILLRNHGIVTTGATLLQAFDRMELLEEAARVALLARQVEGVTPLTPEAKQQLDALVGRLDE